MSDRKITIREQPHVLNGDQLKEAGVQLLGNKMSFAFHTIASFLEFRAKEVYRVYYVIGGAYQNLVRFKMIGATAADVEGCTVHDDDQLGPARQIELKYLHIFMYMAIYFTFRPGRFWIHRCSARSQLSGLQPPPGIQIDLL